MRAADLTRWLLDPSTKPASAEATTTTTSSASLSSSFSSSPDGGGDGGSPRRTPRSPRQGGGGGCGTRIIWKSGRQIGGGAAESPPPPAADGSSRSRSPRAAAAAAATCKRDRVLEATTSRITVCHQINTLFRAQPSFAAAEALAAEMYNVAAANGDSVPSSSPAPPPPARPGASTGTNKLRLLEAVLDALEDAGDLAHVPCEVLANLSLHAPFRRAVAGGEGVDMVLALLRADRTRRPTVTAGPEAAGAEEDAAAKAETAGAGPAGEHTLLSLVGSELLSDLLSSHEAVLASTGTVDAVREALGAVR